MQRIFIDLGIVPHPARGALSGDARPSVAGILGTQLDTVVHFFRNATQEALAASSSGKLTLKAPGALAGAALFLDTTMTASGSGAATIYQFSGILSSEELVEDLGELESKTYRCCVSWTEPGEPEDKCLDFDLVVWNSSARPEDVMPANADAFWEAIKTVAPEANGFTHDDETKTLAVDAGGAPDAHAASHAAAGSDPLTLAQSQVTDLVTDLAAKVPVTRTINGQALSGNVTLAKADLGLGNVENTSDAGKPISTATQTALNGKEPTRTAATQAEAEAGTETAIRSFSPLRIAQAIAALASAGSTSIDTPRQIHVAKNGNDTTGDGSLGNPYLTAQKGYDVALAAIISDAGNAVIQLGVSTTSSFGSIAGTQWPASLGIRGCGPAHTFLDDIVLTVAPGANPIEIISDKSWSFVELAMVGTDTMDSGGNGGSIPAVKLVGLVGQLISIVGGVGGPGTSGNESAEGGPGGPGGDCSSVSIVDCRFTGNISIAGGAGGPGGSDGGIGAGSAGNQGTTGPIKMAYVTAHTLAIPGAYDYGNCSIYDASAGTANSTGGNSTMGPI